MKRLLPSFFLFPFPLFATAISPWFGNVFEFETDCSYLYRHSDRIQSPLGSFADTRNTSELDFALAISPWPQWSFEAEVYVGSSPTISFSYEACLFTGRYLWFDELSGDPLNMAVGVTLSIPQKRFLKDFSYWYHGDVNAEAHLAFGKECPNWCTWLWESRYWVLGGFGVSNRGNPWVHAIASAEWRFSSCALGGIFTEALFGLGSHNIIPLAPFEGYAPIAHRSIDLGAFLSYQIEVVGTLTFESFYRLYAHNFPLHTFGCQVNFLIPFSL